MSPFACVLVNQSDALGFEDGKRRLDVRNPVGGVMKLRGGVSAEPGDRRGFVERKQQLDKRASGLQPQRLDALVVYDLAIDLPEAECLRIQEQRRVEVLDDDRDMVNLSLGTRMSTSRNDLFGSVRTENIAQDVADLAERRAGIGRIDERRH